MLASALLLAIPFIAPPQDEPRPARVTQGPATVHATFKATTTVLAELPADTPVLVLEERAPWYRVTVPGGLPLWVHGNFIEIEGGRGTLPSSKVRARPLPSTGAESFPVGKFHQGDQVEVIGTEGDWVQVVGPEHLGAWIEMESVRVYSARPAGWEAAWESAGKERRLAMRASAGETPPPTAQNAEREAAPVAGAAAAATAAERQPQKKPAPKASAQRVAPADDRPVSASQSAAAPKRAMPPGEAPAAAGAAVAAAEPRPGDAPTRERISTDEAARRLDLVDGWLAGLAVEYDAETADRVETELGAIRWATSDDLALERADAAEARLDAYRTAYDTEQRLLKAQAEFRREAAVAEAAAVRMEANLEMVPPRGPLEDYTAVGWIESASASGHQLVRGGATQVLHVAGGRYDLADFVGREVAIQGQWLRGPGGGRILTIERIRVLPK